MATKRTEPETYEVIESFVSHSPQDGIDYAFRRGDRLPAGHWAIKQAGIYMLPTGYTAQDEGHHRRKHALHAYR